MARNARALGPRVGRAPTGSGARASTFSAPVAPLRRVREVGHPSAGRIWLAVDGQVEQDSDVAKLIWPVPDIIAIISRSMELRPGDLSTTGALEGVAPVERGETMTGGIGPDAKDAARY